jgi:hypothetical protein
MRPPDAGRDRRCKAVISSNVKVAAAGASFDVTGTALRAVYTGRGGPVGQVEGKVAIVTGGAACAATLAREGAKVFVTDLDNPRGKAVVAEICGAGGEALYDHPDISLEESWPG